MDFEIKGLEELAKKCDDLAQRAERLMVRIAFLFLNC